MSTVASVDYAGKRIHLSASTAGGAPLDLLNVYRDVRALRASVSEHRRYRPMIVAGGNVQKTPTTFTQPYVQLLGGCSIVPFNVSHSLVLVREVFGDDGRYGVQCFDRAGVTATVDIDFQVAPVEVRLVATGGGAAGLTPQQEALLNAIGLKLTQVKGDTALIPALF